VRIFGTARGFVAGRVATEACWIMRLKACRGIDIVVDVVVKYLSDGERKCNYETRFQVMTPTLLLLSTPFDAHLSDCHEKQAHPHIRQPRLYSHKTDRNLDHTSIQSSSCSTSNTTQRQKPIHSFARDFTCPSSSLRCAVITPNTTSEHHI